MNRTDRLLALILQLQAKNCQRAEDLASHFEISKRTIYRDIEALAEAGVPVIATPGQGFSLVEGYFLPPLSFTADEATLLLLGAEVMGQSFDAELRTAARSARDKINSVLPAPLQVQVERMRESILFLARDTTGSEEIEHLRQLRRAILRQQTVRFRYHARYGAGYGDSTEPATLRDADPYRLAWVEGSWNLVAYCHLRQDFRTFRLARIEQLTVLAHTFTRRELSMREMEHRMISSRQRRVMLLFSSEIARRIQEDHYFFIAEKIITSNGILVTLHVRQLTDILQWVLGWGRYVRILEPNALRDLVINEAQALLTQQAEIPLP